MAEATSRLINVSKLSLIEPVEEESQISKLIGTLGERHIVVEELQKLLINRPTLVHITFWDGRSFDRFMPEQGVRFKYGDVPGQLQDCAVSNCTTAFAPLFAGPHLKMLYERARTIRPAGAPRTMALYTRYEEKDGEMKPIDYHFLDNFHLKCSTPAPYPLPAVYPPPNPLEGDGPSIWWPNIVVRLSEVYESLKQTDMYQSHDQYLAFFGILRCRRVKLQEYLILIDERDYEGNVESLMQPGNNSYNQMLKHNIPSRDLKGKVQSDLVNAGLEDFSKRQRDHAGIIAQYMGMWADAGTMTIKPYFARWKKEGIPRDGKKDRLPVLEFPRLLAEYESRTAESITAGTSTNPSA
ncbi:hypothetical protein F5Y19DRAFT_486301 [Xylariaceae sp. FL1651]|nr:hypothetical protein F5Y19DRAFT_486301 [Xylariaceae sp. FL1651]